MQVIKGARFGRLVLLLETRKVRRNGTIKAFECACDCGNTIVVDIYNLAYGHTRSCGCLQRERTSQAKRIHGASHTKPYYVWQSMIERCHNPADESYHQYGARGVSVHPAWRASFTNFVNDVGCKPDGAYSLDRIDTCGNYEPGNVRWATPTTQARNRRARHDNNTGVNGVMFNKNGTYTVSIRLGKKRKTTRVRDFIDAVALRYRLEREHWGKCS